MKKLTILVVLMLMFGALLPLSAAERIPAVKGTQLFHISGALDIPLGISFAKKPELPTHASRVGGAFGIGWEYYLTKDISTGVDLSYNFTRAHDRYFLNMLSLGANVAWKPATPTVEFPLSAELGVTLSSKGQQTFVGPHLRLGAAAMFPINYRWNLGPSLQYKLVPEWYPGNKAGHDAYWHQLELGIIAQIRL